jgi:TonB family protein
VELRNDEEVASYIELEPRALARKGNGVPCRSVFMASFMVILASLVCQGQTLGIAEAVPQSSPSSAVGLDPASLALELNRAIIVFKRGLKENFGTRDQYLSAFEKTSNVDSTGRPVTDAKKFVECAIAGNLRTHQVWDEGFPIEVEVRRTIADLIELRNHTGQTETANPHSSDPDGWAAEFQLPPCIAPVHQTIVVSAGVAAAMLKTKIAPIYPAEAFKHNVSGPVVLHATIGSDGHVAALQIISGPAQLHQAALDAVRQWKYHSFRIDS